ncbi:hypothetical protein BVRB_5g112610 [Beta vulgaris subsp. vulgaris]|uniref:Uncharacterized protein n=1 Tax=Beta vulgaris subsp. vulgaris TaxID=3555 RepID=A0A0J8CG27_BETVV|nr:hypothetical protein BVRB_5g112610 [Beta vulgaris subsp. vulgaris]
MRFSLSSDLMVDDSKKLLHAYSNHKRVPSALETSEE